MPMSSHSGRPGSRPPHATVAAATAVWLIPLAFARALAQDPQVLVLDEATSNVDSETEARIQAALDVLLKDRTAIIIAHRLSTIKSANRIIVLRQGKIIEVGNHSALMARGGYYAELYDTYFRHQSLEYIESW